MVSLPSEFRATVETYSGPLDLLLYLIKKEEVDIFDIPLSAIIRQYQLYLEVLRDIDPNACGEFLVVAANLMEIKSKLLLPREELEENADLEDPRMELVRQLLEYKKFKERALLLEKQLDEHQRRYRRPPPALSQLAEELAEPLPIGNVDVWDLLTAFHRVQIALGQRVPVQVVVDRRPLGDFINEVRSTLSARETRSAPFEELFLGARSRDEAIGYFLAILELAKQYEVTVTQDRPGAVILVTLRSEEETRRLLELEARDVLAPSAETILASEGREASAAAARFDRDDDDADLRLDDDDADHRLDDDDADLRLDDDDADLRLDDDDADLRLDDDDAAKQRV